MNRREAFESQARAFAGRSPLYERLARELPDEPLVAALVGDEMDWRVPLQLLAGLHYLVLSGRASWDDPRAALRDEADFLDGWLASQPVQTNEVRRCWWLLPCFLEAARRTGAEAFDLVELGCSGGLNLVWDRYAYRYANGSRPGPLLLAGEERGRVPGELLELRPRVRSRVGVDAAPPDLRRDEDVLLLKSFVWAGQDERLAQLDRAVSVWREDPPEIVRGDLVDALPGLLARRRDGAVLLLWETAVFGYLPEARRAQARALIAAAGEEGPLAFVATGSPADGSTAYYGLSVQTWPGGEGIEVAHGDFHGAWLDWHA